MSGGVTESGGLAKSGLDIIIAAESPHAATTNGTTDSSKRSLFNGVS